MPNLGWVLGDKNAGRPAMACGIDPSFVETCFCALPIHFLKVDGQSTAQD